MARPRTGVDDIATRERLLAAAELAFGAEGFHGARLADIAEAAGIRRPSLLYHFKTKEALYAAVVRRAFSHLGAALTSAMGTPGAFLDQADRMVVAFDVFLAEHPGVAPIILRELMEGRGPGQQILLDEVLPLLAATETFVRTQGQVAPGVPVRAALVQITSAMILAAAAGERTSVLFGDPVKDTKQLVRTLFLSSAPKRAAGATGPEEAA